MKTLPENRWHLFLLAAGPIVWAVHFIASYAVAAIWCGKYAGRSGSLGPVQATIAIFTAIALPLLVSLGWNAYRRHRTGEPDLSRDRDSPEDRHRFLGYATLLLTGLSVVAVIYQTLPIYFLETCR